MADILLDVQSVPSAPSAGQASVYVDSTSKLLAVRNDTKPLTVGCVCNSSVAAQAYTTSEIYLTGSALAVPTHLLQAGAICRWRIIATKTAGTGALIWRVRVGTLGSTGDAEVINLTQVSAPTSATDTAFVEIEWIMRTAGAAATSQGAVCLNHVLAATGFSQLTTNVQQVAGSTFNSTTANLIVGVTFNAQTAGAGNIEMVSSEMFNT